MADDHRAHQPLEDQVSTEAQDNPGEEQFRLEDHHVGGHLYGGIRAWLNRPLHKEATYEQRSYAHLLRKPNLPAVVVVAIVLLDIAALLEVVTKEIRRLAHLLLEPLKLTPKGRRLLQHPLTVKRRRSI